MLPGTKGTAAVPGGWLPAGRRSLSLCPSAGDVALKGIGRGKILFPAAWGFKGVKIINMTLPEAVAPNSAETPGLGGCQQVSSKTAPQ